jgi:phage major head subunit gpT-like protein
MEVSQARVAALMKGFSVKFDQGYTGAPAPLSDRMMDTIPSTAMTEEFDFLSAFPSIKEILDEIQIDNLRTVGFLIKNREFHETIGLKLTDVLGDRLGLYSRNAQTLGEVARYHPDQLLASRLIEGFSGGVDYTGSNFFGSNKRAYPDAVAFSNVATGRLTEARFETAVANLKARVNAKGRPMGLGKRLVLVVSPLYEAMARKILKATTAANGATNVLQGMAELEIWPQLSAAGAEHTWYVFELGSVMKPFLRTELAPWANYTITDPKDSYVILNKQFLWQVYGVSNVGYALPELAYGSDGTVV